jgi:hypothetical protein
LAQPGWDPHTIQVPSSISTAVFTASLGYVSQTLR